MNSSYTEAMVEEDKGAPGSTLWLGKHEIGPQKFSANTVTMTDGITKTELPTSGWEYSKLSSCVRLDDELVSVVPVDSLHNEQPPSAITIKLEPYASHDDGVNSCKNKGKYQEGLHFEETIFHPTDQGCNEVPHPVALFPTTSKGTKLTGENRVVGCGLIIDQTRTDCMDKPHKCTHCDYSSGSPADLARHIITHTVGKRHECSECDYRSPQKSGLSRHMRAHKGEKPYKCSECDNGPVSQTPVVRQVRKHTGEKPYKCQHCSYMSATKYKLTAHMKTHTGEKPYKCLQCDYRAFQKYHLSRHMRTHSLEKPHQCPQCDYRTADKNSLDRHMRSHTGEKLYKCSECDYRSVDCSNLARHFRTHTDDRPHKCSSCQYRCARKSDLVRHIKTHTGEKPFNYSLRLCDYSTTKQGH